MSHFSFTRNLYDDCALDKKAQESTGPFKYITDTNVVESQESCFEGSAPFQHNPFKSIPVNNIDYESDLRGQTRNLSKCPIHKYNPEINNQKANAPFNECKTHQLVPEYTRTNKSCNILAGVTINRFHPLCEDIQSLDKIQSNTFIGTNTRLLVKDSYKDKQ